jgi:chemotaxis response regulator CheB
LSDLSDINEAYLFKIGFAENREKAEKLISKKCCDIILIGENHGVEEVLKLLKILVSHKDSFQNKSTSQTVKSEESLR